MGDHLEKAEEAIHIAQDGEILEETIMAMAVEDMIKDTIIKVIMAMVEAIMVDMITKEDMDTIIMVDMDPTTAEVVILETRLLMVQNKDLMLIMIMNLVQSILNKEILISQLVMDQKQELMAIMMVTLDQSQKILRINSGFI